VKIMNLTEGSKTYTCNVYLVLGTWNAIEDVNTLVDVGRDPMVVDRIMAINTGVGKKRVNQVILTHQHYDHASLLPEIKNTFGPIAYAFSPLPGVDKLVKHGDTFEMGDAVFDVIHTPGHSNDSICLYCAESGILFSGDVSLAIQTDNGTHEDCFVAALESLCTKDVHSVYPGHGPPILANVNELLHTSLMNVRRSKRGSGVARAGQR
jgi:glyoxylase-like metal-dependent hydrolase (beta-lactamase superfamily II)